MLLLLLACKDPTPTSEVVVDVELSPLVATVATVHWSGDAVGTGVLELDGQVVATTDAGTEHEAVLRGLLPDGDYELVARIEGSQTLSSEPLTLSTGSLPNWIPALEQSGDPEAWSGYELIPVMGSTWATLIVDPWGQVVWYRQTPDERDTYRSRIAQDRGSILMSGLSHAEGIEPAIIRWAWDGSEIERYPVPGLQHDFVELPDGNLAAVSLVDDVVRIVEVAGDGTNTVVFEATDVPCQHSNALDYLPDEDAFLLGFRAGSCILYIDRPTGELQWLLGGMDSDFAFDSPDDLFEQQHQFEWLGDGIVVFDNNVATLGYAASRVMEYRLDMDAMEAHVVWSYMPDPIVYTYVLGDVDRLENGDTRVIWATAGLAQQLTSEGESVWELSAGIGTGFGYSTRYDGLHP